MPSVKPCPECEKFYPECKCPWWACSNGIAHKGYFEYLLDVEEGARTTTCPVCGRVDSLVMLNILTRIKPINL